jgi:ring-1,2-phenylacetyl-CoA epoxidase subunit PaaB
MNTTGIDTAILHAERVWEVLKQDSSNKVPQAVGSVHAADAKHALLAARNVFVRRPSAVALWVIPQESLVLVSDAELQQATEVNAGDELRQDYVVFAKTSTKRSMVFMDYLATVASSSPIAALHHVQADCGRHSWWWVVASKHIVRGSDDAATQAAWFLPAQAKTYRQQSGYGALGRQMTGQQVNMADKPPRGER